MNKVVTIINNNGDRFDILKESVAAVLKRRDGKAIVFTIDGAISLGLVAESADQLRQKLLEGGEDDENL